jgi:ribosome-binding factor A
VTRRTERVNDLLQEELSALIQREIKDPRMGSGLTTVTSVEVSPDLRHATVFVSHLGDEAERDGVLLALQHSARFLHGQLLHRLAMKRVPEFIFRFDPSIERGDRLARLINEVNAGSEHATEA